MYSVVNYCAFSPFPVIKIPQTLKSYLHFGCSEIGERAKEFFSKTLTADCQFSVQKKIIPAHRVMLAMASPVFEIMFYGSIPQNNEPIVIKDIESYVFELMIEYIYSNTVTLTECATAYQLYYSATKYMLTNLSDICVEYLMNNIDIHTAARSLEFSMVFNEKSLKNMCLFFISCNTGEIVNQKDFNTLHLDTVETIYDLEKIFLCTPCFEKEVILFRAAVEYAKAQVAGTGYNPRQSLYHIPTYFPVEPTAQKYTDVGEEDVKEKYLEVSCTANLDLERSIVRRLIKKLRILTFTPEQFSMGPGSSNYLTDEEKLAFFHNISCQDTNVSVPEGFNSSFKRR